MINKAGFFGSLCAVLVLGASQASLAEGQSADLKYDQIVSSRTILKSTEVLSWESVEMGRGADATLPGLPTSGGLTPTAGDGGIDLNQIINIGKQIWDIVQAGKPVVNVQTDKASALPKGISDWTQLESWQAPISKTYEVSLQNVYGMNVVTFEYRVIYVVGGSYKGKGQFIGYATIEPASIDVMWGYTLNATSKVASVFNRGTSRSPIGAMQIDINYQVSSVMTNFQQTDSFSLAGDGQLVQMQ